MTDVPQWWAWLLLVLAACRLTRLVAYDDLTIPLRRRLTGLGDEEHKQWAYVIDHQREVGADPWDVPWGVDGWAIPLALRIERATGKIDLPPIVKNADPPSQHPPVTASRYYASKLLRCAWCVGFYISAAWWIAWLAWPTGSLIAATPFAVSEAVGLISKQLDP